MDLTTNTESDTNKTINAQELGLEFYTTKQKGWPITNFSTEELIKGVRQNNYKWRYNNSNFSEDQVLKKVKKGEIVLSNGFYSLEEDEYRKIRCGLVQERSPISERDPRLRRLNND